MKTTLAVIGMIIAILGITWIVQGNAFFLYKVFAPKMEAVRRQTFEQSKAYNQGMIQDLQNMQFEYYRTDTNHQDAIASLILHRAADFDQTILAEKNPDLYQFIEQLKQKQTQP